MKREFFCASFCELGNFIESFRLIVLAFGSCSPDKDDCIQAKRASDTGDRADVLVGKIKIDDELQATT